MTLGVQGPGAGDTDHRDRRNGKRIAAATKRCDARTGVERQTLAGLNPPLRDRDPAGGDTQSESKHQPAEPTAVGAVLEAGNPFAAQGWRTQGPALLLDGGRLEAVEAFKDGLRLFAAGTLRNRFFEQAAGGVRLTAQKCRRAGVDELFPLALTLRNRAARALDVGTRARMAAIQKQDPGPYVDRAFVVPCEIVVQPAQEELFDAGVTIALQPLGGCRVRVGTERVCHQKWLPVKKFEHYEPNRRATQGRRDRTASMPIIECIPNLSEGRRLDVVERLAEAVRATPGAALLDYSSDASHNRSVFTLVGDAASVEQAILRLFEIAVAEIDLRQHQGEHPRLGAVDVVPFVPIEGVTMQECVALAKQVGATVADRFNVPVYLYEEAASNPSRRNLEDIRRGEFEGLAARMTTPGWTPDFGPAEPHPSAGATVIGARMPLIAYNINLNTNRIDVARKIAAAIRHSSGGLRYVKAMGIMVEGRDLAQVSMNLTNYQKTPIFRVFEVVKREAERYGVSILESEVVGLIPAGALVSAAEFYLQLERFSDGQVLENKLRGS